MIALSFILTLLYFEDHSLAFASTYLTLLIMFKISEAKRLPQWLKKDALELLWQGFSTVEREIDVSTEAAEQKKLKIAIGELLNNSDTDKCAKIKVTIRETDVFIVEFRNLLLNSILLQSAVLMGFFIAQSQLGGQALRGLGPIKTILSYFAVIVQALWTFRVVLYFKQRNDRIYADNNPITITYHQPQSNHGRA
jgi:hypothetical protein